MKAIAIYDPAMCCPTGVCGSEVDPKVVQFASDLAWLNQQGVAVSRFNLAQQPAAFADNPIIREALTSMGSECLPLILIDGAIATRSIYPTREQLALLAGVDSESSACCSEESAESEGCCGGEINEGCCS